MRERRSTPRQVQIKGWHDWVTEADLESQRVITNLIRQRHPDHGFLPEEKDAALPTTGAAIWIIDPVDGTSNFSRQAPLFSISIAAVFEEQVVVGVVYDPIREEMFSAATGAGSFLNGKRVRTSEVQEPIRSIVAFDLGHTPSSRLLSFQIMERFARDVHTLRILGSAALALSWVAAGRLDAYMNLGLKPWDLAAAALLIKEAGGSLTDLEGRAWKPTCPPGAYLATNGRLHDEMLLIAREPNAGSLGRS